MDTQSRPSELLNASMDIPAAHRRMIRLLVINIAVAVGVPMLVEYVGAPWDPILLFLIVALILTVYDRSYGRYLLYGGYFLLYLVWEIIVSSVNIAWLVLQPNPPLDPGIVAVPLELQSGLEVTALASAITLTPGTLSLDLARDHNQRLVLYVHALRVGDPEAFRRSIHTGFETLIQKVTTGVGS
jgi:multicomponent Na+:H+ antiporter subunit E